MDDTDLLEQAKAHYQIGKDHYEDIYSDCKDDWLFAHGDGQWDDKGYRDRIADDRPCLVFNMLLPYINQAINDIKQARLAIRVVPIDSDADVKVAEKRAGIIRNIEKQSASSTVYGAAAMNAIGAGIGWICVDTDYADYESFDVEPYLDRVLDFESCMIDPSDMSLSGMDAEWGFKRIAISDDEWDRKYEDFNKSSFDTTMCDDGETVIVKYYWKEYTDKEIFQIKLIDGSIKIHDKDFLEQLDAEGVPYEKLKSRKTKECKVWQALLSGEDVLEKEEFPAPYIPLVPVYGEEYYKDGKRRFRSLINQAKDSQRMYNYAKSAHAELLALQPKPKFYGAVGSFNTDTNWDKANSSNIPFLQYDIVSDPNTGQIMPPPTIIPPAQGSPALVGEAQAAKEDIRLSIGMPQSNMGERSNAVSGVAIRSQQVEGDNATFHFIDNLSASIAQVGRILNEMIPVLYSDRKVARIIGENGDEELFYINQPLAGEGDDLRPIRNGEQPSAYYDLSVGKYDVDIDTGASYSSKRQETADKLIELARARPEILDIAGDILFEVLDVPMAREIAERIRSTMPPEMLGDDPSAARLQQAGQAIAQLEEQIKNYDAALQDKRKNEEFNNMVELKKLEQEGQKISIDAQKTFAEIEKMRAETANYNSEAVERMYQTVAGQMEDLRQAIEIIVEAKEAENGEAGELPEDVTIETENTYE